MKQNVWKCKSSSVVVSFSDEDMTHLDMAVRKVSSFLYILFSYFENRLVPKDIIIIRSYGEDYEIPKERHGGGEDQQGTSKPSWRPKLM